MPTYALSYSISKVIYVICHFIYTPKFTEWISRYLNSEAKSLLWDYVHTLKEILYKLCQEKHAATETYASALCSYSP